MATSTCDRNSSSARLPPELDQIAGLDPGYLSGLEGREFASVTDSG